VVRRHADDEGNRQGEPTFADGDQSAVIYSTLRFAKGAVGVLETNWARSDSHPAHRTDEVRLTGTDGYARMVLDAEERGAKISVESTTDSEEHEQGRPAIPAHSYLPTAELHGQRTDSYRWQLDHFIDVARGGAAPLTTWEDGLRALQLATALTESYERGTPVEVTERGSGDDGEQWAR